MVREKLQFIFYFIYVFYVYLVVRLFNNGCLSWSSCPCVWRGSCSVCVCLHESRLNSTSGVWGGPLWTTAPIFQIVKGLVHHAVCMSQSYFSPLSECSLVIFHSRVLLGYLFCACVIWKTRAEKRNGEGSRKLKSLSETEDLLNRSPRDLKVTHYSSSI